MPKSLLAGIVVFAIVGVLIYFAMSGQTAATCEVCIEFNGQTQCRTAKAPTKQEAILDRPASASGQEKVWLSSMAKVG